jgi:hypothetical protein
VRATVLSFRAMRRVFALAAVAIWVLAGPIAMTFGACAMMASMGEAPCGISVCTFAPPLSVAAPHSVAVLAPPSLPPIDSLVLAVLELPPKPAPLAA